MSEITSMLLLPIVIIVVVFDIPYTVSMFRTKRKIKKYDSVGKIYVEAMPTRYKNFVADPEDNAIILEWKQFLAFYSIAPENYKCSLNRIYYKGQRILLEENDYYDNYLPWFADKYTETEGKFEELTKKQYML